MRLSKLLSLTTLLLLIFISTVQSQKSEWCDGVYVWKFSPEKASDEEIAKELTDAAEAILSQHRDLCKVLQRRKYAKLLSHYENEVEIQTLKDASKPVIDSLNTYQAKTVVFGKFRRDFEGNIDLRLSFENITSSQILADRILITNKDASNIEGRERRLKKLIDHLIIPTIKDQEFKVWMEAFESEDIGKLKKYIENYPQGEYTEKGHDMLKQLVNDKQRWEKIRWSFSILEVQEYLSETKSNVYADSARMAIESLRYVDSEEWKDAKKKHTIEGYTEYLESNPEGRYKSEAKNKKQCLSAKTTIEVNNNPEIFPGIYLSQCDVFIEKFKITQFKEKVDEYYNHNNYPEDYTEFTEGYSYNNYEEKLPVTIQAGCDYKYELEVRCECYREGMVKLTTTGEIEGHINSNKNVTKYYLNFTRLRKTSENTKCKADITLSTHKENLNVFWQGENNGHNFHNGKEEDDENEQNGDNSMNRTDTYNNGVKPRLGKGRKPSGSNNKPQTQGRKIYPNSRLKKTDNN